ncbi:hypothetical protein F2Q69_00012992 [Brassica cretica]|uniref:Uncharacterized protein n=1 Tax=Brassica cretica TaxID=69181 RepID=A0A8S9QWM0_BRACR|nr:hypothetical protein F2Q69_00012992 [Brassica cretica]
MPKIDVARPNALRPKPKPLENPPETVRTPSDDGVDPMEFDRVPKGRTLRKRKEKVAKHLKRGSNEKEKESFRKRGYARDQDGNTIRVHNRDIRRLLEKASRDEPSYICLPEHASSFTHTKLVPEIYTKNEINEMFYGVCGEHEKNKEAF